MNKKHIKLKIKENIEKLKNYGTKLKKIKILDPACGSGAFLVQVFDHLENEWIKLRNQIMQLYNYIDDSTLFDFEWNYKNILQENIYGVDKNLESVQITKLSLWLKTANQKEPLTTLDHNIKVGNSLVDKVEISDTYVDDNMENKSLAFNWKKEFPQVFESGGFDIILGNPPYGALLNEKEKKYLSTLYPLVPDYEIYMYFISKSFELLSSGGFLSFIFPNTFLSNLYAKNYRKSIIEKFFISSIADFSKNEIFHLAKVRTCICVFEKVDFKKDDICNIIGYDSKFYLNKKVIIKDLIENIDNLLFLINIEQDYIKIIEKVKNYSRLLNFFDVSQGYIPYDKYKGQTEDTIRNRIYHADKKLDDTYKIEIKGRNLNQYLIDLKNYSYQYVKYGTHLANPRSKKYFINPRVLVREITAKRLFSSYTKNEYYNDPSIINIIEKGINQEMKLKYILAILNSTLIGFYHKNISPKSNKGLFPKILINDIKNLPIPEISIKEQEYFIQKVDYMLKLNKDLQNKTWKSLNFIKTKFDVNIQLSLKLQKFYNLNLKDFLNELNKIKKKKIEESKKEIINSLKVKSKLTLIEEKEWSDFFNKEKVSLIGLKNKIQETDRKLNNMIYNLYELNQDEINIVEKYFIEE